MLSHFLANDLERQYAELFSQLFARVQAQQPEKGIQALITRARVQVDQAEVSLEAALRLEYEAAVIRTEARLKLTGYCELSPQKEELN